MLRVTRQSRPSGRFLVHPVEKRVFLDTLLRTRTTVYTHSRNLDLLRGGGYFEKALECK